MKKILFFLTLFLLICLPIRAYCAEGKTYSNVLYTVDNDSHNRVRQQDVLFSSSSPVYFFLCLDSSGNGTYYAVSASPMTWLSDHFDRQNVQYYSLSGYSSVWDESKIAISSLGWYYPRTLNPYQKETLYLQSQILVPYIDSLPLNLLYDFIRTGNDAGFDYSNWEGEYNTSLGALKNVSLFYLTVEHSDGDTTGQFFTFYDRIRYASKSTKGYDLKSPGTKIRVYLSMTYVKVKDPTQVYKEGPKILVGEYDATNLQIEVNLSTSESIILGQTPPEFIMNGWEKLAAGVERSDRMYLQIFTSDNEYGDLLRISNIDKNGKRPQDVVDSDGSLIDPSDGGYSTPDTDGGFGTSTDGSSDDAFDNLKPFPSDGGISGIIDNVGKATDTFVAMLNMIGSIPSIFARLFTFLPPWCLAWVSGFFVALTILIVYKLIRG